MRQILKIVGVKRELQEHVGHQIVAHDTIPTSIQDGEQLDCIPK
jgi:hypothetical protein